MKAAAAAMGAAQVAFAAFTEMCSLHADWEKTQQDFQAAMQAHAELESTLPSGSKVTPVASLNVFHLTARVVRISCTVQRRQQRHKPSLRPTHPPHLRRERSPSKLLPRHHRRPLHPYSPRSW